LERLNNKNVQNKHPALLLEGNGETEAEAGGEALFFCLDGLKSLLS
jgi:hypothetical protein